MQNNDEKPSWWNRFTQNVKDGSKTMSRKTMNLGRTFRSETRKVGSYMNREDTSEEKNNRNIFNNLANKIDLFFASRNDKPIKASETSLSKSDKSKPDTISTLFSFLASNDASLFDAFSDRV